MVLPKLVVPCESCSMNMYVEHRKWCDTPGCVYLAHTDSSVSKQHCCKQCEKWGDRHGKRCEKSSQLLQTTVLPRPKPRPRPPSPTVSRTRPHKDDRSLYTKKSFPRKKTFAISVKSLSGRETSSSSPQASTNRPETSHLQIWKKSEKAGNLKTCRRNVVLLQKCTSSDKNRDLL